MILKEWSGHGLTFLKKKTIVIFKMAKKRKETIFELGLETHEQLKRKQNKREEDRSLSQEKKR